MACLHPIRILNPKRQFSQAGGHPLYITVPCGKCAECQKRRVSEYQLRAYYEALDCFNAGGFILNDTLTYSDSNLPHLSFFEPKLKDTKFDFPCFSHVDFRLFFVRLRTEGKRRGIDLSSNFKYFLASEYGTSEGHSHRPHYHVLFFVRNTSINPLDFSRLISDCWRFGLTDGLPYKPASYLFEKRIFSKSSNSDLVHLQSVVNYVTKYLCKDSTFTPVVNARILSAITYLCGCVPDKIDNPLAYQRFQTLKRNACQFHRNSHGFGLCALDSKFNKFSDIFKTGMMAFPSSKGVVKHIPIPSYFARKLFYNLTRDFRGQLTWQLNNTGVAFRLSRMDNILNQFTLNLESWFINLPTYCPKESKYICTRVRSILSYNNRSFKDFATYLLYYKDRLIPSTQVGMQSKLLGSAPSLDLFVPLSYEDSCPAFLSRADNPNIPTYVSFHHYLDDKGLFGTYSIHDGISLDVYSKRCISQNTYIDFRYFDELYNLYVSSLIHFNDEKQRSFDLKQHLLDVQKSLQTHFTNPFFS